MDKARDNSDTVLSKNFEAEFPAEFIQDVRTSVEGTAYVYTSAEPGSCNPPVKVLRTRFTPYSDPSSFRRSEEPPMSCHSTVQNPHWQPMNQDIASLFQRSALHPKHPKRMMLPRLQSALPDDCWELSHGHAVFTIPPCTRLREVYRNKFEEAAEPTWERLMPHDNREVECLLAFCRAVTFMKKVEEQRDRSLGEKRKSAGDVQYNSRLFGTLLCR